MAEAWIGNTAKPVAWIDSRLIKLEYLQPRIGKSDHDQTATAYIQSKPFTQIGIRAVPVEPIENRTMKQINIKSGEPVQVGGCNACVMKAKDHLHNLATPRNLGDRKTT